MLIPAYIIPANLFTGTACFLASTTGLPCPGCGITRAFSSLITGNLRDSLWHHPLLIPAMIIVALYFAVWASRDKLPRAMGIVLITFAVALVALYAVRMVFLFPGEAPLTYNHNAILPRLYRLIF